MILRAVAISISIISAIFGSYWVLQFSQCTSPDRAVVIAPLFFCGFPLTFLGNLVSMILLTAGKGYWYDSLPIIICYFVQWQAISWYIYRKGVLAAKA